MWKGDDSLCADGRSCEFFLMCWMSAGLLDGSCGGIMYACCHRIKDAAKASNAYNLVDEAREQIQSLTTDSFAAETTGEERKFHLWHDRQGDIYCRRHEKPWRWKNVHVENKLKKARGDGRHFFFFLLFASKSTEFRFLSHAISWAWLFSFSFDVHRMAKVKRLRWTTISDDCD